MQNFGLYTPSETAELLEKLGHSPRKKLGQNFLVDSNIVRKSLELAEVREGDVVVEVGPGLGTLTGALLQSGARVYAVELDKRLHAFLEERFGANENFNLINADAVDYPLAALPDEIKDFKIVANLPYAISTPWLDAVLSGRLPKAMSLMLQKEVASRFAARGGSKDFSPISICLGQAYDILPPHKVSASCFFPRPAVDSALLPMRLKQEPFVFCARTKSIMRAVFSKRRKQIGAIAKDAGQDSEILLAWLQKISETISADRRPETLPPEAWKILDSMLA